MSGKSDIKKEMTKKQYDFLEVFEKNNGLVIISCKKYGIDDQTYYNWKKKYKGFAEKIEMIQESMIDMAESQLYKNIRKGDNTSILFYLKCKGKKRGYIEKQEVEHSGDMGINIKVDWGKDGKEENGG